MDAQAFTWEVVAPERSQAALGGRRPTARLLISSSTHGEESLRIPRAVGRRLEGLAESGGHHPQSRAELLHVVRSISSELARSKAEDLLNRRDFSSNELRERLRSEGYLPQVADEVVDRFCEVGLLDDARFADLFIRSKLACGWGRVKIERELARRGIECDEIAGWPEEYLPSEDEEQTAYELASRRRLTGKNDFQKIVRFLCGRGFPMGVAMDAAKRVLSDEDE